MVFMLLNKNKPLILDCIQGQNLTEIDRKLAKLLITLIFICMI